MHFVGKNKKFFLILYLVLCLSVICLIVFELSNYSHNRCEILFKIRAHFVFQTCRPAQPLPGLSL
jgi:hypothetical protein